MSYNAGNLGPGATCHETMSTLAGGVCGNFTAPRTFTVNGTTMGDCTPSGSGFPTTALNTPRNGGFCFQASAGSPDYAYFGVWGP